MPAPRTPTCPPGAALLIERPCRRFSQFDLTADALNPKDMGPLASLLPPVQGLFKLKINGEGVLEKGLQRHPNDRDMREFLAQLRGRSSR